MKNAGIWLDKDKAYIVSIENGKETMLKVSSNIEHFHIGGGSGSRLKGGPQDVIQDSKYLEREKHQFKSYFNEIIQHIKNADALMLFGPSDTNNKLKKELNLFYKKLDKKVLLVKKTDSMTLNQTQELVRNSFQKMA
jgi:hypothetical protein